MSMKLGRAHGFSMVEVLVAILVFSIGLLGLAGLQSLSLASSHVSALRSVAVMHARDMADRMRANLGAVHAPVGQRYHDLTAADRSCRWMHFKHQHATPANCTPQQLAEDDLFDWQQRVAAALPSGVAVACIDSTPQDGLPAAPACDGIGNAYALKVWWTEKPDRSGAAQVKQFVTVTQP